MRLKHLNKIIKIVLIAAFITLLIILHIRLVNTLSIKKAHENHQIGLILPNKFLKITSFGFKGLRSDLLYLKSVNFLMSFNKLSDLNQNDWHWFYRLIDASTYLDPYFQDPLFLANAMIWPSKCYNKALLILKRGAKYRSWDWRFPFFVGFDYFYFLKDYKDGTKWLLIASKRRHSPSLLLVSLASALTTRAGQLSMGIKILENQIAHTKNKKLRKYYTKRLKCLKNLFVLEKAIYKYKMRFGHFPKSLSQLIDTHILKELPKDPFGAIYKITPKGHIKRIIPHKHKKEAKIPLSEH